MIKVEKIIRLIKPTYEKLPNYIITVGRLLLGWLLLARLLRLKRDRSSGNAVLENIRLTMWLVRENFTLARCNLQKKKRNSRKLHIDTALLCKAYSMPIRPVILSQSECNSDLDYGTLTPSQLRYSSIYSCLILTWKSKVCYQTERYW